MNSKHAILTDNELLFAIPQTEGKFYAGKMAFTASTVPEILDLALQCSIGTIWIAPGALLNYMRADQVQERSGNWDIICSTHPHPFECKASPVIRSIAAYPANDRDTMITLVCPQWTAWAWDPKEVIEAKDPVACLSAIHYLEQALATNLQYHPGITGRRLIEHTNRLHSRPRWVEAPNFDLGQLGNLSIGQSYGYHTPITGELPAGEIRIEAFRKDWAPIAAASSVALGTGDPEHLDGKAFRASKYESTLRTWYNGTRPGYWRLKYQDMPPLAPLSPRQQWVSTPVLKMLFGLGAVFQIVEAYVWPEHHRVLDDFASQLWAAYKQLANRDRFTYISGAQLAMHSIERIAESTIHLLASPETAKYAKQWYRPDWKGAIVEEARVRLLYKVAQIAKRARQMPILLTEDMLLYLTQDPDLARAFPEFDRPEALGGWKHMFTRALTPEIIWDFALPNKTAKDLLSLVCEQASQPLAASLISTPL